MRSDGNTHDFPPTRDKNGGEGTEFHSFLRWSDKAMVSKEGRGNKWHKCEGEPWKCQWVEEGWERETEEMGKQRNPLGMSDSGEKWKKCILIGSWTLEVGGGGMVSNKKKERVGLADRNASERTRMSWKGDKLKGGTKTVEMHDALKTLL